MRVAILFFYFLCSSVFCFAQSLTGIVIDVDTKEPAVGVNVYLNCTTYGCTTDNSGKYNLDVNTIIGIG